MSGQSQGNPSNLQTPMVEALQQTWGWFVALGVSMIAVGALAIVFSGLATFSATIILGSALLAGGLLQGVHAFFVRNWSGFFMQGLTACLYVIVGFMVLANPIDAMFMLTLLLAVFFLFEGLVKLFLAFQLRPAQNWMWVFFSGVLSLVLSAIIWMNWPGDAVWIIGLLLGINILFGGWATLMFTLGVRGGACGWTWGSKRNVTPTT